MLITAHALNYTRREVSICWDCMLLIGGGLLPKWQRSEHPACYQDKISVMHEGIDTDRIKSIHKQARVTIVDPTISSAKLYPIR